MQLSDAYRRCQEIAAAHYENFPVASYLLPAAMRPHVAAVYAFARAADDFADEGSAPADQRLAWLDAWRALRRGGLPAAAQGAAVGAVSAADVEAIFLALQHTIVDRRLDPRLLDDLLSAFAQDVTTTRYATWEEVLDYCRRSANPVGRLVLGIAGVRDEDVARQSDAVCTALQLANFWQDLGEDWKRRNRLYVPRDLMDRHGAATAALDTGQTDAAWHAVVSELGSRTQLLFDAGKPVCDAVRGRLRYELRATWLGGTTVLRRTLEARRTSLHVRPTLTRADALRLAMRVVVFRTRR